LLFTLGRFAVWRDPVKSINVVGPELLLSGPIFLSEADRLNNSIKRNMRLAMVLCLMGFSLPGGSQERRLDKGGTTDVDKNSVTIFSSTGLGDAHLFGSTSDRHLTLFGIEYRRSLVSRNRFGLSYTPELIPIAVLFQPSIGGFGVPNALEPFTHTQAVFGLGANPVGVEMSCVKFRRVKPFIGGNLGFLYFSKNVPLQFAAQLNFAADVKAGLDVSLNNSKAVTIAYVLHHFSNGYEAIENPGLDSQMLFVGFKFRFPARLQQR